MVPEAPLEPTQAGLVPAGDGWFVLNARAARWRHREGRGESLPFEGRTDFPQAGITLFVLGPGEPIGMYLIVGAGDAPCAVLAVSAREHQAGADWGGYTVDEVALRHSASVEEETTDQELAYARFPESVPTRYRDGWLPG